MVGGVRSCVGKGCIPRTSWSSAKRLRLAAAGLGPVGRDRRDREIAVLTARAEKAEAELARTKAALDLVGKHMRSWRLSPRARGVHRFKALADGDMVQLRFH